MFLDDPEFQNFCEYCVRLLVAAGLGGVIGIERKFHARWAGLRTHILVALAAAIFTMSATAITGNNPTDITRVIQGIAAGIGFLGAGTILKLSNELEVKGLTTASTIWLTAALGITAGLREYALAAAAGIVSLAVLLILRPITKRIDRKHDD